MNQKEAQDLYFDVVDMLSSKVSDLSKEEMTKLKIFMKLTRVMLFRKKKEESNVFNPNRWLVRNICTNKNRKNLMYIIISKGLVFSTDGKVIAIDNSGSKLVDGYYNKDFIKQDIDLPLLDRSAVENINPTKYEAEVTIYIDWDRVELVPAGRANKHALKVSKSINGELNVISQGSKEIGKITHLNGDIDGCMRVYERKFDAIMLNKVMDGQNEVKAYISTHIIYPMKIQHSDVHYGFISPLANL